MAFSSFTVTFRRPFHHASIMVDAPTIRTEILKKIVRNSIRELGDPVSSFQSLLSSTSARLVIFPTLTSLSSPRTEIDHRPS